MKTTLAFCFNYLWCYQRKGKQRKNTTTAATKFSRAKKHILSNLLTFGVPFVVVVSAAETI